MLYFLSSMIQNALRHKIVNWIMHATSFCSVETTVKYEYVEVEKKPERRTRWLFLWYNENYQQFLGSRFHNYTFVSSIELTDGCVMKLIRAKSSHLS